MSDWIGEFILVLIKSAFGETKAYKRFENVSQKKYDRMYSKYDSKQKQYRQKLEKYSTEQLKLLYDKADNDWLRNAISDELAKRKEV